MVDPQPVNFLNYAGLSPPKSDVKGIEIFKSEKLLHAYAFKRRIGSLKVVFENQLEKSSL